MSSGYLNLLCRYLLLQSEWINISITGRGGRIPHPKRQLQKKKRRKKSKKISADQNKNIHKYEVLFLFVLFVVLVFFSITLRMIILTFLEVSTNSALIGRL
jgi:hypothetical protein